MLRDLAREEVNIVTLEDPVEYYIPGVSQCQINEKTGMTFAGGLRAILRQDPDIISVGEIRDGETAFDAICRHYPHWNQCARFMEGAKIDQRHAEVKRLVDEFHADGVIYENMKFCEYWGYERAQDGMWFYEGYELPRSVPVCQIEKDYTSAASGQLRTRFQAFIESLEIKKIQAQQ